MMDVRIALLSAATIALLGLMVGLHRSRLDGGGKIDVFHPLVFPLAYISFSFLAPAWAMLVTGANYLGFNSAMMSPATASLMFLSVTGLTLGLALGPRRRPQSGDLVPDPRTQVLMGRILLMFPLALSVANVSRGLTSRGLDQTTFTPLDAVRSLALIVTPAAVLLITNGHRSGGARFLGPSDLGLVSITILLMGIAGNRGGALAIVLALLYAYTRRRTSFSLALGGLAAALAFSVAVVRYRSQGSAYGTHTPLDSILTDLSVATYSTGITASLVPDSYGYALGSTYASAIIRQLPSPLANVLIGPPTDTGNQAFRDMIGYTNPNQGFGYSLPAEGYLNFGAIGVLGVTLLFGFFTSWAYSRAQFPARSSWGLLYPVIISTLPLGIRSDALGQVKAILYPMVILGAAYAIARTITTVRGRRLGATSGPRTSQNQTRAS